MELITAAMQPDLEKAELTLAGFELLSAVFAGGGKAAQADIAKRLGISPPSLSESVRVAVRKGFLVQTSIPGDARVKRLQLTPRGKSAVRSVMLAVNRTEVEILEGLDNEQVLGAVRLLREINGNLARKISTEA